THIYMSIKRKLKIKKSKRRNREKVKSEYKTMRYIYFLRQTHMEIGLNSLIFIYNIIYLKEKICSLVILFYETNQNKKKSHFLWHIISEINLKVLLIILNILHLIVYIK